MSMKKFKREVSHDGVSYKVRSDTIEIPDFASMSRFEVQHWLIHHTYARGYSKASNPLQGMGGAISISTK